jgi:hypothetical protein
LVAAGLLPTAPPVNEAHLVQARRLREAINSLVRSVMSASPVSGEPLAIVNGHRWGRSPGARFPDRVRSTFRAPSPRWPIARTASSAPMIRSASSPFGATVSIPPLPSAVVAYAS